MTTSSRNLAFSPEFPELGGPLGEVELFTQEFDFTTGETTLEPPPADPAPLRGSRLRLRRVGRDGGLARLRLTASRLLHGRSARLSIVRHERGCGPAFASAAGACGWRRLGPTRERNLQLRRARIVEVREPKRWQKVEIAVRTRSFRRAAFRVSGARAELTIRR